MATYDKTKDKAYDKLFKIILAGKECVGKTSISGRFTENEFNLAYIPTISEF